MHVCVLHMCLVPPEGRQECCVPRAAVTGDCALSYECWAACRCQVLLTTEQPNKTLAYFKLLFLNHCSIGLHWSSVV